MFTRYKECMTHERSYNRKIKKLNDALNHRVEFCGEHLGFQIVGIMLKQAMTMVEGTNVSVEKRKEMNKQIRAIEQTFYPLCRG